MANWYRFNQGEPWYGSHDKEFYDGYWAFDVCGLVKILGIDDDVVKDHKYYPYDLVHFNDTATTEIYTGEDTLSLHDALPI